MKNHSKIIYGNKYSQESLKSDLRGVLGGQPTALRYVIVLFTISLATISGSCAGILGGFISWAIFFSSFKEAPLVFLCIALVAIIGVVETLRCGLSKGLITIIISILLASILLAAVWRDASFVVVFIFFIILAVTPAFCSFLTGSLSSSLIFILFSQNQQYIKIALAIFITAMSVVIAYLIKDAPEKLSPQPDYINFVIVQFAGGFLSGIVIAIASLSATCLEDKPSEHFTFLRSWAIAIGSWGGTSFYNLDLSNVNFTGAKLANTDLRAKKLYRTCFQGVTGLERARVDNQYLDLENPKVQKLLNLTFGYRKDKDFSHINLQGAYLQNAIMQKFQLIETNLTGADLQGADLRGSIFVRTQVTGVDFTGANLTGICIEDLSVNSQTCFTGVQCKYIYRKLDENGKPTDRYPPKGRNFETGEFESLYQQVGNIVELVFKEGVNWRALSFTFRKFQLEDDGLGLELKGVEQRGDLWVVKVTHKEGVPRQEVEQRVSGIYDELKSMLAVKEQQINKLLGIAADQAEALKSQSKLPFGNSFFILGSTITNLAGSGQIEYDEAANKIRNIVANGSDLAQVTPIAQNLLAQFQRQNIATSTDKQVELIQQVILAEMDKDPVFKQLFVQQGQQIADAMPERAIATAIRNAIAQLT